MPINHMVSNFRIIKMKHMIVPKKKYETYEIESLRILRIAQR